MDANQTSNSDDIAARRDARRRKILENSKNRLTRITGRDHTDENDKKTSSMYSIGHIKYENKIIRCLLILRC